MFSEISWLIVSEGIQVQRHGQTMSLLLWIQRQMKKQIALKILKARGAKKEILFTLFFFPTSRSGTDVNLFLRTI